MNYLILCERSNYLRHFGPILSYFHRLNRSITIIQIRRDNSKYDAPQSLENVVRYHSTFLEWNTNKISFKELEPSKVGSYIKSLPRAVVFSLHGYSEYSLRVFDLAYLRWIIVQNPDILFLDILYSHAATHWLSYDINSFELHKRFLYSHNTYNHIKQIYADLRLISDDYQSGRAHLDFLFPDICGAGGGSKKLATIFYGDLLTQHMNKATSPLDKLCILLYRPIFQNSSKLLRRLISLLGLVTEENLLADLYRLLKSSGYLVVVKTRDKRSLNKAYKRFFDIAINDCFYYPTLSHILSDISDITFGFASSTVFLDQNSKTIGINLLPLYTFKQITQGSVYCKIYRSYMIDYNGAKLTSEVFNIPLFYSKKFLASLPIGIADNDN